MSEFNYQCTDCGTRYSWRDLRFCCECGGLFDLAFHRPVFERDRIQKDVPSILRYIDFFPECIRESLREISLGEGWTPVIPANLSDDSADIHVKMDHLMPTQSFKDRGAVLLVALAHTLKAERIVQDSSGNAGYSVAVYAARAGIPCEIFVPASTQPYKVQRIKDTGARVRLIAGSREATAVAAFHAAMDERTFYASHVYNPLFHAGTMTYCLELFEQFGRLPARILLPMGNGTLVLGVLQGLGYLKASGVDTSRVQIVAVQAENCAPIAQAYEAGATTVSPVTNQGTLATGIAIAAPIRGTQLLQRLAAANGQVEVASESAIENTKSQMARRGLIVEPTTAATFCPLLAESRTERVETVIPACGGNAH